MKILFMGTPDFSVGSLDALISVGHEIVGVFTQPDKPKGRKMVLTPSAVKVYATEKNLKIFQPNTLREEGVFETITSLSPEMIVVVAYGKMLPENILSCTKYGCVNVHASLLPKYRGAAPIQWSIVCGERETGVTTMYMDKGIDTGDILLTEKVEICDDENAETLFEKLSKIGAKLLVETVSGLEKGSITPVKQDDSKATYAPIIKKEMGEIDFSKTAKEIDCLVRGLFPWPATYFTLGGKRFKVLKAKLSNLSSSENCGVVLENKNQLVISCGNKTAIEILEIQPEGKGAMTAAQMLNGYRIEKGSIIS